MIVIKTRSLTRALRTSGQLFSIALTSALIIAATATSSRAQTAADTSPALAASGTDAAVQLDRYTVSASRTPQDPRYIPSSVTLVSLPDLAAAQITTLRDALGQVPGVNVVSTGGGIGSQSSVFMRGTDSDHVLFLVDGIRMNTESGAAAYNNFLGGADLGGLDRLEVLRGPQSTLYGSSAIGGVISLETARGSGPVSGNISIDGGSFNTIGASAAAGGSAPVTNAFSSRPQSLSYSAALSTGYTENDRDFNTFKQLNGSTRIEYQLAGVFTAGFTYRGVTSKYEEPGPAYASDDPSQSGIINTTINLLTAYADWHPITTFHSRLIYGWVQNQYDFTDGYKDYYPYFSTRNILDWQNTWNATDWLQLVAGVNAEWSNYYSAYTYAPDYPYYDSPYSPNSGEQNVRDNLQSIFVNAILRPVKNLEVTVGGRGDRYNTDGSHATARVGAAYFIEATNTKLHATFGTGFNAPAPEYRLGGMYYAPNPGIKPEESRGWDIGIDQNLLNDRLTLGVTYFQNRITNMFSYGSADVYPYAKEINIARAKTQGVEVTASAKITDRVNASASYTYLDARDADTNAPLARRPRHTLDADVTARIITPWIVGVGAHFVAGRPDDSAYIGYSSVVVAMPSYTTVRLFTSYDICKNLTVKVRVENLLNKKYEEVIGYPALPLGVFGGIEWKF